MEDFEGMVISKLISIENRISKIETGNEWTGRIFKIFCIGVLGSIGLDITGDLNGF